MYVCKRCWKYAHQRWRDLKLPCAVDFDSLNCRGRDRILDGKHPDPYNGLKVSKLRHLNELQRGFAAFKMTCAPSLIKGRSSSAGIRAPMLQADNPMSAQLIPTGAFLVRAPEHIRTSDSRRLRDQAILDLYGIQSEACRVNIASLGREFLERRSSHPQSDTSDDDEAQELDLWH